MEDSTSASGSESVELNNSQQSDCCSASVVLSATDWKSIHARTFLFAAEVGIPRLNYDGPSLSP